MVGPSGSMNPQNGQSLFSIMMSAAKERGVDLSTIEASRLRNVLPMTRPKRSGPFVLSTTASVAEPQETLYRATNVEQYQNEICSMARSEDREAKPPVVCVC